MILLALFLLAVGNEGSTIGIILVCWLLLLTGWLFVDFRLRKKEAGSAAGPGGRLEEKYLIAEVAGKPHRPMTVCITGFCPWRENPCWSRYPP